MLPVIVQERAITGGQLEDADRALKTIAGQGTEAEEYRPGLVKITQHSRTHVVVIDRICLQ